MPCFAAIDNTKLYYQIEGTGQPVIFIHGWSGSHDNWRGVTKKLRGKYQCISYDHRGHGASGCPEQGYTLTQLGYDLHQLMTYLDLKDVVLAGHSMGVHTIFSYISLYGCGRISKIALLDMSPKLVTDEHWKAGAFGSYPIEKLHEDMELIAQDVTSFMWQFWKRILPEFATLPETMKPLAAPGLKGVNHTLPLMGLWQSMCMSDYRGMIRDITVPILYIIPEKGIYPIETAEFIRENASASVDIVPFAGCTHMSLAEKPAKTAECLMNFIK